MRRGFTLLEVLVALAVVAIAVAALSRAGSQAIDAQHQIERRTLAFWVADNLLSELRLESAVEPERRRGTHPMGGRDWHWEMVIEHAPGGELLRVDVAVHDRADSNTPVLTHTGFLPR